jgi:hypothetical protein
LIRGTHIVRQQLTTEIDAFHRERYPRIVRRCGQLRSIHIIRIGLLRFKKTIVAQIPKIFPTKEEGRKTC